MQAITILGPGRHQANLAMLRESGLEFPVSESAIRGHRAELIVVLGGDGTIHRFLPQLIRSQLPVLLLPSGSGNDFAHALGVLSVRHSVQLARDFVRGEARIRDIDVGLIADSAGSAIPFCCIGGLGLDVIAAEFANKMPRWLRSRGGYLLGALRAAAAAPRFRVQICADGRDISTELCLISFANTPSYGGGLRIAPDAQLEDGKLDCVLVEAMSALNLLRRAPSLLSQTHLRLKEVTHFRAETLLLKSNPVTWIYADGEPVCQTPAEVRVSRQALKVICAA
jgi:diacylglycerol kinase (ATP)